MSGMETKAFATPEEKRPFVDKGQALVVTLGDRSVVKGTFEPGWRWSEHVGPIAGTASCQSPHLLYVLSGRMAVRMEDGSESEIGPDDVASIDPGHDAWVVGEAACVCVDFGISPTYAQHQD
ncbi:cupin domain-containing protein [Oryzihumus sp.]